MVISVDGQDNLVVVTATSLTTAVIFVVMILSCVTCKCWRRFTKKDVVDDEDSPDEVYTNPSFDDAPQKTTVETKRKKLGSSVVTNSPINSIEPYQEIAEGVVLQNRFTNEKKENLQQLNEFNSKNGDVKSSKSPDDKPDTERVSQSEHSYSSNTPTIPADAVSNSSTIIVSVEVHCTNVENGKLGVSGNISNSPKQNSILENPRGVDDNDRNGIAVHINPFAVERLEENMRKDKNSGMSIAL
ncbi:uncharacterized protein [Antedon mediterranea]|uniref:uncharacterized protein n=1 Tax=Antedon mediterranea TaxID=105859 RepID=UPI003AF7688C